MIDGPSSRNWISLPFTMVNNGMLTNVLLLKFNFRWMLIKMSFDLKLSNIIWTWTLNFVSTMFTSNIKFFELHWVLSVILFVVACPHSALTMGVFRIMRNIWFYNMRLMINYSCWRMLWLLWRNWLTERLLRILNTWRKSWWEALRRVRVIKNLGRDLLRHHRHLWCHKINWLTALSWNKLRLK